MGEIIRGLFQKNIVKNEYKTSAIIAAGGTGSRMGLTFNKLFLSIDERPVLSYTLDAFEDAPCVDEIILVCNEKDFSLCTEIVTDFGYTKVISIVVGGASRQDSVYKGLQALSPDTDVVVIHDGARPLVTQDMIRLTVDAAYHNGAAAVGVPPADTVKYVKNNFIADTLDRTSLSLIQTPQAFLKDIILDAHNSAQKGHILTTDDCALVELMNHPVAVVPGSITNIKLTTPDDYELLCAILQFRRDFE